MDLASTYDANNQNINLNDVLHSESLVKGAQNLHAITLYVYPDRFVLEPNKGIQIQKKLVIEKKTGRVTEIDLSETIPQNFESKKVYSLFMGILNILDKSFLLMVHEILPVCNIENNDIFAIASASFIPFESEGDFFRTQSGKEAINYILNIRKLLLQGYYFSYTYDLTLSKVKRATNCQTEVRFQWNHYLYKDLTKWNIDRKWRVPVIQGFIGYFNVFIQGKKLEYFLISRRSSYRSGTRYNARGVDDDGNVANFVESEQITYYNGYCCSHCQIRGSVPSFWQQTGLTAQAKITRNFELTKPAFVKHCENINANWGRVLCVNLMAKHKKEEQMITDTFEELVKKNDLANIRYEYFDFHHAVRGQRFDRVNSIIHKLQPMIENFRFYVEDTVKRTIQLTQKGTVRTNCLDCLDRTNFFQGKVAIAVFDAQMRQFGVDLTAAFGEDPLSQLDNDSTKACHPFISNFKNIWADNGDAISIHYAGTGSVISNVTRTGKRNFFGLIDHGMKTISRFYIGNFEDQIKQECIDVLVGQHTETVNVFGEAFEKAIKEREKDFSAYDDVSVMVASWNVAGFVPTSGFDMSSLFNTEGNPAPDVIVVGLQEYIVTSASSMVMSAGKEGINLWQDTILSNLKFLDKYDFVREKHLQGMLLLIFAKEKMRDRITKVEADVVKTGGGGYVGNKGATLIKLFIDDSSFCFINCHIEPGPGSTANNTRLLNLIDIHQRAFQAGNIGRSTELRMNNLDYKFLFGDTNFRVNYNNNEVRALLENYNHLMAQGKQKEAGEVLSTVLSYDQLNQSKGANDILEKYQEGAITFLPTYKYDTFSNTYDTSKKQRVPSWTDRILWSCNFGIVKQLFYNRREYKESDHRPVVSYFVVEIKKVNHEKKEETMKQVYENDPNVQKTINEEEEALKREVEQKNMNPEGKFTSMGYLTRDVDAQLDANGEPLADSQ